MIIARFDIDPVAKGRPRFGNGRTYTPAKTTRFENALKVLARKEMKGDAPLDGALTVRISFVIKKPKTSKNNAPSVKPDLDNFLKAAFDAFNGIFWNDDAQVCVLRAEKVYSDRGRIEVMIDQLFK